MATAMTVTSLVLFLWLGSAIEAIAEQQVCDADAETCRRETACSVYFDPDNKNDDSSSSSGLVAGIDYEEGQRLELVEPLMVIKNSGDRGNSLSNWRQIVWASDLLSSILSYESLHNMDIFVPGIGTHIACAEYESWINVRAVAVPTDPLRNQKKNKGSSMMVDAPYDFGLETTVPIQAGDGLFISCNNEQGDDDEVETPSAPKTATFDGLACITDTLETRPTSTISSGRGVVSKRMIRAGEAVAVSPVMPMEQQDMTIYQQGIVPTANAKPFWQPESTVLRFSSQKMGQQVLWNYCFGHPDSTILLLPTASHVNFINHASDQQANVKIEWTSPEKVQTMDRSKLLLGGHSLTIRYVALRNIQPGEELFLNYGSAWEEAYRTHEQTQPNGDSKSSYISAAEYERSTSPEQRIRTEDDENSLPPNLFTTCYYKANSDTLGEDEDEYELRWHPQLFGQDECLRPCRILEKHSSSELGSSAVLYTVEMLPMPHYRTHPDCALVEGTRHFFSDYPSSHIKIVDKPTALADANAFRHYVQVSPGFFPPQWMSNYEKPWEMMPPPAENLKHYEISSPIERLSEDGNEPQSLTANIYELGLTSNFTQALSGYLQHTTLDLAFQHLLLEGNPQSDMFTRFGGHNWYIQRPKNDAPEWKVRCFAMWFGLPVVIYNRRMMNLSRFSLFCSIVQYALGIPSRRTSP